jgi:4-hydroxy-tetrahydrodipicolinate reductase
MPKKTGKTLRVALAGAGGRMGREIRELIGESSGFKLVASVDGGSDWKRCKATDVDVVIDFSTAEGMRQATRWCVEQGKALVSGTTGISATDRSQMVKASAQIPLLYSANMSLGIAVLGAMFKAFGPISEWDFQIEEAHHGLKKDRPSGTALLLQDQLTKVLGRPLPEPHAIRGGGIPGIHQVWAMGPDETLILQHTAFQRKVFARGALKAASWLFDKKQPGLYDLSDLYKMK